MAFKMKTDVVGGTKRQQRLFCDIVSILDRRRYRVVSDGGPFSSTAIFERVIPEKNIIITTNPAYFLESGATFLKIKYRGKIVFKAEHRFKRFPEKGKPSERMKVTIDTPGRWEQIARAA
jgi:hypothetical protein